MQPVELLLGHVCNTIAAAEKVTTMGQIKAIKLALRVRDEGRYHIVRLGETPSAYSRFGFQGNQTAGAVAPGFCDGLIDLNSASAELTIIQIHFPIVQDARFP